MPVDGRFHTAAYETLRPKPLWTTQLLGCSPVRLPGQASRSSFTLLYNTEKITVLWRASLRFHESDPSVANWDRFTEIPICNIGASMYMYVKPSYGRHSIEVARLREEARKCRDIAGRLSLRHENARLIEMAKRFDAEADCLKAAKAAWSHNPADNDAVDR